MKKQTLAMAHMLIKNQSARLDTERDYMNTLTADRIAALMTSVLNFYSELSALHTQALIEELTANVAEQDV